jgi:hypothetical protein
VTGAVDWGRFVGLPHRDHGRDASGVDCWGLLRLVYAEALGVDLPDYLDACPSLRERADLSALIEGQRDAGGWQPVQEIAPFDALLFRVGPHATHIAVAVDATRMLHVAAGSRSVIERIDSPTWRKRRVGVYRLAPRQDTVHAVAVRGLSPDTARRRFDLAPSVTVAQIVAEMMPGASDAALDQVRVTLSRGDRWVVVPRRWWPHVRPHGGSVVTVRIVPGLGTAAINVALFLASNTALPTLAVNILAVGAALAVGALGVAALNALIRPPALPDGPPDPEDRYSLRGWRNQAIPGEPIPSPMGRIRVAPVYAMQPFQEVIGDEQYMRALFCFGYGRLGISDLKIGDTSIDEFEDVEYELREGAPGEDPVTLTPIQVIEQPENIELRYVYPLDSAGNPDTSGGRQESPVTRTLPTGSVRAGIVLHFPGGLFYTKDNGDLRALYCYIRIRQRAVGTATWSTVTTLEYWELKISPFFRQFTWDLGTRGDYEVEITRVTESDRRPQHSWLCNLTAVQGYRPEYPIATSLPLALCAIKVRASYQLNGPLDSLNAVVTRYAPDLAAGAWPDQQTRNPASLYALALQGVDNAFPAADSDIDWDMLADWHGFCEAKGLHYDRDHRAFDSLLDRLRDIAAAGRAAPWHDGARWSVLIDRPADFEVDHITPRNSRGFTGSRTYLDAPHAVRVRFRDETAAYADSEVVVPWPGRSAPYDLVEQWDLPGKTNAEEIRREIYRQMLSVIHRRDRWTVEQDGALRVATRGDWVRLSHHVLSDTQWSGRVTRVDAPLITLDEAVTMETGQTYAIRFLDFDGSDTVGRSVLTTVATVAGETRTLRVTGTAVPAAGALVQFGVSGEESERALVLDVEPGQDFAATLTLTNAAPQIDTLSDAYVPTTWDPIIGEVVDVGVDPGVPQFAGITTRGAEGEYGTAARELQVRIAAAAGGAALIAGFELDHRLQGAGSWTTVSANGAPVQIALTYDVGDVVELRARAADFDGDLGDYTATETVTVGSDLAAAPATPALASISVTGGLGAATLSLAHSDAATSEIQIFRTADGDALDTDTDTVGAPVTVAAGQTVAYVDGDSTRTDLVAASWTNGGGWGSATLPSTHSSGSASTLSQALGFTNAETYRGKITVSGRTAGSVTVEMTGGSPEVASAAISTNGQTLFSLDAEGGNTTLAIVATSDFDGTLDSVTLFLETPASAPQGIHDYRFAALNSDGIGSAVSSEITVTII